MANAWLRLCADTSNDPKLIGIAQIAKVPFVVVLGLWTHILCRARKNETPGIFTDTPTELACTLGIEEETVIEILAHLEFHNRNLIDGNRITKWDKHQKASDSSAERVARWRREQTAKKEPQTVDPIKEPIKPEKVGDVVTLHRTVNPNVRAANQLGTRIMELHGVLGKINLFNQITSPLTPLLDSGIPECFIEETINRVWDARESKGAIPTTFQYYVPAVKQEWDKANQKLEGTNQANGQSPYRTGPSRNTGEDEDSRRKAILAGLRFPSEVDSRRTGST
jgi:hypothetical protein